MDVKFCTCTDHACRNHPTNHELGCTRCVAKCLHEGEIPSCFFKAVSMDLLPGDEQDWSYRGFAAHVLAHADERGARASAR